MQGGTLVEDLQVKREIVLEADAETLEKMRKEGHARGFTVRIGMKSYYSNWFERRCVYGEAD
jgi:hypothetical protein